MHFSKQLSLNQPIVTRLFSAAAAKGKLARAYLLAGNALEDKWVLARELAAYLNCSQVQSGAQNACLLSDREDWCTSCRWLAAQQHPQALIRLSGEGSKSGKIAVEQARALVEEISKTSSYTRVVVIEDAGQEVLHRPAANTLLKTIEEPRTNVLLIFFTQSVSEVLATVVSRCQVINMSNNTYKNRQCFSLLGDSENEGQFLPNQLEPADDEQKRRVSQALEKFFSQEYQFIDAVNLADNIQFLIKETGELEVLLDFFVTKELLGRKSFFTMEKETRYAKELFLLGQIAKEQSKHYVGQKALVETFVFAWYKLKQTGVNPLKLRI